MLHRRVVMVRKIDSVGHVLGADQLALNLKITAAKPGTLRMMFMASPRNTQTIYEYSQSLLYPHSGRDVVGEIPGPSIGERR